MLTGSDTEEQLMEVYNETVNVLGCGGFPMAKLITNNVRLACAINQTDVVEMSFPEEHGVLGMKWRPFSDEICFKVLKSPLESNCKITKRSVVSGIAQIFDPSGIIAPVVIVGKILIQDLWKSRLGWDDELTPELRARWLGFCESIENLKLIHIKRWIGMVTNADAELHVFADASEKAYGAVAYIRIIQPDGGAVVNIIGAKSKVAPIKKVTIPRLELMAGKIAAELSEAVIKACSWSTMKVEFWTDSSIVLHWLRQDPNSNKVFVANCVSSILEIDNGAFWQHVSGIDNPADLVSRGVTSKQLSTSKLWWHGPKWLALPRSQWPENKVVSLSDEEIKYINMEAKEKLVAIVCERKINALAVVSNDGIPQEIISRKSTLNSSLRVSAYVIRFVAKLKARMGDSPSLRRLIECVRVMQAITPQELDMALFYWIRIAQKEAFPKEIRALKNAKPLLNSSNIIKLRPMLDSSGMIRVGGRLANAVIPEDAKHQLIIPATANIALLLIRKAHFMTLHGGPQLMIAYLRQRFWIPKMRQKIRKYINSCVVCIRFQQNPNNQLMADLPTIRVVKSEPFANTGLDFAGPFNIRQKPERQPSNRTFAGAKTKKQIIKFTPKMKAWLLIFTCMVTKAVHIDVTIGLTTEEFLAAFARFVNRKGRCLQLFSDNGTTFVGASNELCRVLQEWSDSLPATLASQFHTHWNFITPAAPHQGGVWESMVKRTKHHLRRTIGNRLLTREELYTVGTQIEGILNSRPLWPMSDDPLDLQPITPAHLILGKPILPQPLTECCVNIADNRLTHWGLQQKIQQHFWRRWQEEYLIYLQQRNKWFQPQKNVKIGDMVILCDDNMPPANWSIGRVIEIYKSKDGFIRSAKIKTSSTELDRPINKLCVLPLQDQG